MIVVGSLNADLVARAERLPGPGETVAGEDLQIHPGGKGANQAFAAAALGGEVAMVGLVGADGFGELLLESQASVGVGVGGIARDGGSTGSALITVLPDGENAIVVSPGANARLTPAAAVERVEALLPAGFLLCQLEVPLETVAACLASARRAGVVTLLDPAPARDLPAELLAHVDYLTPNESELGRLLGCAPPDDLPAVEAAARELRKQGAGGVVVTLGARGCFVLAGDVCEAVPGFPVEARDTTGAGDTWSGSFAVGLSEGLALADAARLANAAAALSVTRAGAQSSVPSRGEVDAFLSGRGG